MLPSVAEVVLTAGDEASVSVVVFDALGDEIAGSIVRWSVSDADIASVSPGVSGQASAIVRALAPGATTLVAAVDGVAATVDVEVRGLPHGHATIVTDVDGVSDSVQIDVKP